MRKTYATRLHIEIGDEASEKIGHNDPRMTIEHYVDSKKVIIAKGEQNKKRGGLFNKEFKF